MNIKGLTIVTVMTIFVVRFNNGGIVKRERNWMIIMWRMRKWRFVMWMKIRVSLLCKQVIICKAGWIMKSKVISQPKTLFQTKQYQSERQSHLPLLAVSCQHYLPSQARQRLLDKSISPSINRLFNTNKYQHCNIMRVMTMKMLFIKDKMTTNWQIIK